MLNDLEIIATLGIGGFGRVELVSTCHYKSIKGWALFTDCLKIKPHNLLYMFYLYKSILIWKESKSHTRHPLCVWG